MTLLSVPVIDIAPFRNGSPADRAAVAAAVDAACRDIGFLVVSGHGVPERRLAQIGDVTRRFFDLPIEEKLRVRRPAPDVSRGYVGIEGESVGRSRDAAVTTGDLNESFMIGPVDLPDPDYAGSAAAGTHFAPNLWPEEPAELRRIYCTYYRAMGDLAALLMEIFAVALELPDDFFADKIDKHISRLRVRNYPEPAGAPLPGQLRVGAHSDYGSLTILATEDRPGGLQVRNSDGDWVDAPIVPGAFIINIGDLLARWTNDRWVSTLHRVVNPDESDLAGSRRQSVIFFHNPNYDAEIRCIPTCVDPGTGPSYEPITSGAHLRRLFVATQNVA
ncbi:isopenicillin N synthase family dioxygenase [Pseudonocardia xinjiangensis]|uniref:isopenicillin N synthase family dioxygenase n=1 Tax=Pseudonocardia xinjiangensis TaxID=75289 RepID=UPI003D8DDC49